MVKYFLYVIAVLMFSLTACSVKPADFPTHNWRRIQQPSSLNTAFYILTYKCKEYIVSSRGFIVSTNEDVCWDQYENDIRKDTGGDVKW